MSDVDEKEFIPVDPSQSNNEGDIIPSIIRKNKSGEQSVPLWLITFTDVMALMLTFFVLLYSMAVPQEEKWDEISAALSSKFKNTESKMYNAGSQDAVSIDKIKPSTALDLNYLKVLITNLLKDKNIKDVLIFQNGNRLIISVPSDLLFESGRANINLRGKRVLFTLGGALSRVKNRVEIVGHADPTPITSGKGLYSTNWELSLARSASVAAIFKEVGYDRHITIRGVSSARYDELSEDMPEEVRNDLSRRVDIVLMGDAGFRTKLHALQ